MKCVFFDRDGILNQDRGTYSWSSDHFILMNDVPRVLMELKKRGYLLIVITNQAGIAKGLYSKEAVYDCHEIIQGASGNSLDDIFYSPYHPNVTESLSRKPGSILFERAISKYEISIAQSWMVGDRDRDIIPARKLGLSTILLGDEESVVDYRVQSLIEILNIIQ